MSTEMNRATWRKSSKSPNNSSCVEVANVGDQVGVRDTKDPDGPVLWFGPEDWSAFVARAREGGYDLT